MTPIGKLPSFAGQILRRTGKPNRLDMDDSLFTERIAKEQQERTVARKIGQIRRAQKKKTKAEGLKIEPSVQQEI